jgi:gamma-glutamyltranspeptidase/glutathione hydrolase
MRKPSRVDGRTVVRPGERRDTRAPRVLSGLVGGAALAILALTVPARAMFAPSAEGGRLAVTTDNGAATEAALATLGAGGNAVDAAITAALTMGVVNPVSSGLGGGGFALVYMESERKPVALDFREVAPRKIALEDLMAQKQRQVDSPAKRGSSVGVPGEPAGLEWLSKRYGKRSLAEDAAPAADVAERGFFMSRYMGETTADTAARLARSPELAARFLPGGNPLPYRARVTRPDLARTIRRFGAEGARSIYEGTTAAKMVAAVQAAGGTLDAADLAAYQVKARAPLERTVDGRTIATMPAPSAGGLMLLETLEMFGATSQSPLRRMGFGSSSYLHTIAEAMRGAIADRVRFSGDPDSDPGIPGAYDRALDPSQISARRSRIEPNRTRPAAAFRTREQGTTNIIVADAAGNVVSLTTTVNAPFGSQVVAGDTGILMNDELDDFSSPEDIVGFGVIGLGPNRPKPGVRPVSSMTPTIVFEGGVPILASGGSGGTRIATGVTQVTLARLIFDLDPSACVSSPRIHATGGSADLTVDPDIIEDVRAGLRARGETLAEEKYPHASMQLVAWDRTGGRARLLAATDPRKGGMAAAQ